MLVVVSALKGYAIEASDGCLGTVSDFLFDDKTWKMRWLVVDVGSWLIGRTVLIHPSAITTADHEGRKFAVKLTKAQVEGSPDTAQDLPVSRQVEFNLNSYYGWDPLWAGNSYFGGGAMASPLLSPPLFGSYLGQANGIGAGADEGDPHLRSVAAVDGYHLHASDGDIGHLENLMVEDSTWIIHYLIVDTRNWWPGQHVLLSPHAVEDISYLDQKIRLNVSCDQVKGSPPWGTETLIDRSYERALQEYYAWPGYGW